MGRPMITSVVRSPTLAVDRQVVVTLPPETPIGRVELLITVAPQQNSESTHGSLRQRFGTVHSGDSRSADNEHIDAVLNSERHLA